MTCFVVKCACVKINKIGAFLLFFFQNISLSTQQIDTIKWKLWIVSVELQDLCHSVEYFTVAMK